MAKGPCPLGCDFMTFLTKPPNKPPATPWASSTRAPLDKSYVAPQKSQAKRGFSSPSSSICLLWRHEVWLARGPADLCDDHEERRQKLVGIEIISLHTRMTMSAKSKKQRPVHEVRLGRVRAAIWENETENGSRHNVTVSRLYKDGDNWRDSTSFGRDDLPLLCKVLNSAHSWIFAQASENAVPVGDDIPF